MAVESGAFSIRLIFFEIKGPWNEALVEVTGMSFCQETWIPRFSFFFFIISASLTSSRQRVVRFEKNLTADCQLGAAPALDKDKDESFVKPPAML